ncbi:hypothetical protein TNCV_1888831 [Trichonephila clavipes]|nr:hypothetical protein TNCV_1888831 [Trichonephila clavipes]
MIKITASSEVWMKTKSLVNVAAIVGNNRCHTPGYRIKRALDVSLGVQQSMWLPHIAKFGPVLQRVVFPGSDVVQSWIILFRLVIDRENKQAKKALNVWEGHGLQHLIDAAPAFQCTVNAY